MEDSKCWNAEITATIQDSINVLLNLLMGILMEFQDGTDLTKCEDVHRIYLQIGRNEICTQAITHAAWLFSMLVLMTLFGMMMMTLRMVVWSGLIERKNIDASANSVEQERIELTLRHKSSINGLKSDKNVGSARSLNSNGGEWPQNSRDVESLKTGLNTDTNVGSTRHLDSTSETECWDYTSNRNEHDHNIAESELPSNGGKSLKSEKTMRDSVTACWDFTTAKDEDEVPSIRSFRNSGSWDFQTSKQQELHDDRQRNDVELTARRLSSQWIAPNSRGENQRKERQRSIEQQQLLNDDDIQGNDFDLRSGVHSLSEMTPLHSVGANSMKGKK